MDSSRSEGEDHDQLRRNTPKKIRVPISCSSTYGRSAKPSQTARLTLINADDPQFRPVNTLKASRLGMQTGSNMDVFDEARCRSLDRRSLATNSTIESKPFVHLTSDKLTPTRPHVDTSSAKRDSVFSEGFSRYRRQALEFSHLGKDREAQTAKQSSKSIEVISDDEENAEGDDKDPPPSLPRTMAQSLLYPEGRRTREQMDLKPWKPKAGPDLASFRKQLPVESLRVGDNLLISTPSLGQSITLTLDQEILYLAIDKDDGKTHMIKIGCDLVDKVYYYFGSKPPSYADLRLREIPLDLLAILKDPTSKNTFTDVMLMRVVFERNRFSRRITSSILRSHFRGKAKELSCPSSYRPNIDSVYETARHDPRMSNLGSNGQFDQGSSPRALKASSAYCPTVPPDLEANPRLLFTYPPDGIDVISINSNDMLRLAEGYYLNDSIIELDLRRLYLEAETWIKEQVHIFSSFLYRKLAKEGSTCSTIPVNIFERTFSFIPINEHLHWYLALIYNPMGAIVASASSNINDGFSEGHKDGSSFPAPDSSSPSPSQGSVTTSNAYVVIFDSLGSKHRRASVEKLKAFICSEARLKMDVAIEKRQIGALYPKLPLQKNSTDCGCFLLEYVDRFLQRPNEIMDSIIERKDLSKWFSHGDAELRRLTIKKFIEAKSPHPNACTTNMLADVASQPSASSDIEEIYPLGVNPL